MSAGIKQFASAGSPTVACIAKATLGSTQMYKTQVSRFALIRVMVAAGLGLWTALAAAAESDDAFIPRVINSSTIPSNGDLNPYGVAFVPERFPGGGVIAAGDVLASNFNSSANVQGTGTTIVQLRPRGPLAPPGTAVVFFTSSLPGLSTALGVLGDGFVVVGNVPTPDGMFDMIRQGALQVIDRHGHLVQTLTGSQVLDCASDLA